MKGWIKLHRTISDHWLWSDKPFDKRSAWIDILLMANHKGNKFLLGNDLVEVEAGSFITSEVKLMDRWGWSKSKVRNFLSLLEKDNMLVKKSDKKKTTLTVVNYRVYQDSQTTEEPQKNYKKTSERPQEDHGETTERPQKDTNNNVKELKNEENENNDKEKEPSCPQKSEDDKKEPVIKYPQGNEYLNGAILLRERVLEVNPNMKVPEKKVTELQKWANSFRLMVERDKRSTAEVAEVIDFVFYKSEFWNTVIQSADGLRKNYDKIRGSMMRDGNGSKKNSLKPNYKVMEEFLSED